MSLDLGTLGMKVQVDTSSVGSTLSKVKRDLDDVKKSAEKVEKSKVDVTPKGTGEVSRAKSETKALGDELGKVSKQKPDVAPKGTEAISKAKDAAKGLGDEMGKAASSSQKMRVPTQPAEEMDRAKGSASGLKGVVDQLGSFGPMMGLAAAAGGVAAGFKQALDLGNAYTNEINTMRAVSGATDAQLQAVSSTARQLGSDTSLANTSASDAAAAMTELAKGGFSVDESMTAAKGTLQLAAAAGVDAATAATIQSQALQAFGLDADYAAKSSDILANAANQSSAEISDIAAGLQQSGAVANQFGLTIEDTSATLALLANAGIKGSDAGTLLKSTLLAVTDQGKPAQEAIEQLGLTVYDANGKFVGMSSLMEQLQNASENMTDEQYQAATATLFGSDAMRLAGVAAQVGGEGFDDMRAAMDKQGAAADVAAARTQGLPGAIAAVENSAEELALTLYDRFSGPLESALDLTAGGIGNISSAMASVPGPALAAGMVMLASKFTGLSGTLNYGSASIGRFVREAQNVSAQSRAAGGNIGFMGAAMGNLSAKSQTVGRMSTAFTNASTPLRLMGIETRGAASEMSGLQRALHTAAGGVQTFGGVAAGAANGGLSLLKSGAGGLIGALGGPWGLAITGATAAIGALISSHQEAKAAEEEHKAAQDELRGSLDTTTGAITAQTRELVAKKLEESGGAEAARELSLSQGVVADAAMGNASAQRQVRDAISSAREEAVAASGAWQKYGAEFEAAGFSLEEVTAAATGNVDIAREIMNHGGLGVEWNQLAQDVDGATSKFDELGNTVNATAEDLGKVQSDQAADALANLGRSAEQSTALLAAVGDSIVSIPDEKTVIVSSMAPNVKEDLEEIGLGIERLEDGTVKVTFPEGMNIVSTLDQMGVKLRSLEDGRISISDNTPEVQQRLLDLGLAVHDEEGNVIIKDNISEVINKQVELGGAVKDETGSVFVNDNTGYVLANLQGLGFAAQSIPPGSVHVVDNTPETMQKLQNLNIETASLADGTVVITDTSPETLANLANVGVTTQTLPPGYVQITDTSPENMARLDSLGIKTTTLPKGQVIISDNANDVASHVRNTLANGALNSVSQHTINIVRNIKDIFSKAEGGIMAYANGGVTPTVERYADGGERAITRAQEGRHSEPPHKAHIAPAGAWRLFAEPETGGEAYIPLAASKRGRSEQILAQVAQRFGLTLTQDGQPYQAFAEGGVIDSLKNVVQSQFPMLQATSTFRAGDPGHHGRGEAVDFSNGYDTTPEMQAATRMLYTRYKNQLAELIHYPLNGWNNVEEGNDFDFGAATNSEHRNHVHVAARQPLSSPVPVTNEGLDDYESLNTGAGKSTTTSTGTSLDDEDDDSNTSDIASLTGVGTSKKSNRKLNGGAGTLIKDGSLLELTAALYSKQTGTPMQDDVVSWGQAIGLYSESEEEDDVDPNGLTKKKATSELAADRKKVDKLKTDLPEAEEKLRIQKMRRDDVYNKTDKDGQPSATDAQKAEADLQVEKAQRRVDEIQLQISELEAGIRELEDHIGNGAGEHSDSAIQGTSGNKNADAIIREGKRRGITDRGIQIALATALVESEMKMYANESDPESMSFPHDAVGSDHDSVGLFQQRNNGAWGTTADRMDPEKSAGMFYDKLDDQDYNQGDPGAHAQRVQVSAFPGKYALRMDEAMQILQTYEGSAGSGVKITPMANGGILGGARSPQIRDSSAVLWAEAGPEAYIPLSSNKQAASRDIWLETGKRLGMDSMSMISFILSGMTGLVSGNLDGFNTGSSASLSGMGLNTDAAAYRGGKQVETAVGAVFNGPVQINDPRKYLQGQLGNAAAQIGNAMRSFQL